MIRFVEKRKWYFLLSSLIIVPGLIAMIYLTVTTGLPVKPAIDFTGGTLWQMQFDKPVAPADLRAVFAANGAGDPSVTTIGSGGTTLQARLKPIDDAVKLKLAAAIKEKFGNFQELQYSQVGPAIGNEVTRAALIAIAAASVVILGFMVVAFRKVPNPFRYGLAAILAMLHDLLLTMGIIALAGIFLGWEADALFLTAILTVISFSMQDTIVVFDRIRENTPKYRGETFSTIADRSLMETVHRSLATQLNAIFIMVAVLLFGGATMKQFIAVMLIGLISGSYSSIFIAVPLLAGWVEKDVLGLRVGKNAAQGVQAQQQPTA
jgi:preprotein translocase SecF subunit